MGFANETPAELSATLALGARLKLLGVETVQFHRLRLWPPARLTQAGLHVEFDLDSLRIEYPFTQVPEGDIAAIQSDQDFFGGYFVPASAARSPAELAQVEMFFHHAVVTAPLTVAALTQLADARLVSIFYRIISNNGPIERERLDWDKGNLHRNWLTIRPLLDALITECSEPDGGWSRILRGLFDYEEKRLRFTTGRWALADAALGLGDNWVALKCASIFRQPSSDCRREKRLARRCCVR
jgi:hypothetical protein